jgi:hypothetical protein
MLVSLLDASIERCPDNCGVDHFTSRSKVVASSQCIVLLVSLSAVCRDAFWWSPLWYGVGLPELVLSW